MAQERIAMLRAAQSLGLEVEYLELGNELYYGMDPKNRESAKYGQRFPSGVEYGRNMSIWIAQLKQAFPRSHIGAVAQRWAKSEWN